MDYILVAWIGDDANGDSGRWVGQVDMGIAHGDFRIVANLAMSDAALL